MVHHEHRYPCLDCEPESYIRMVQGLIERCLCFHMTRDDCVEALSKHNIQPIVTLAVWKELLKENKSFFQAYDHLISPSPTPRAAAINSNLQDWKIIKEEKAVEDVINEYTENQNQNHH